MNPEQFLQSIARGHAGRFDQQVTTAFCRQVLGLINDAYFRSKLIGFEEWDERNDPSSPVIYVSNHSGMALPWDAICFVAMLFERFGYRSDRSVRTLISPFFMRNGLLSLYQIPSILTRSGGFEATYQNFQAAMHLPEGNILIYPEGLRGIGKGFDRRYEVQQISTSVIRMAIEHKTDIVHFATVNAEYIHPFAYRSDRLNRWGKRLLNLPFLPLTLLLPLILLQPWVFYLAFPARLTYVRKSRIGWKEMLGPDGSSDNEAIQAARDRLRDKMQLELREAEQAYGRRPYDWSGLWQSVRRHWRTLPFWLPVGWPLLFWEFQRQYERFGGEDFQLRLRPTGIWRIFLNQPSLLAYYLPIVGWLPILWWSARLPQAEIRGSQA